jgi:Sec-independent protein translocase protein TatA
MHIIDILVIAGVVLALFGPKMLQSIAHDAGKGLGKAKEMKDTLMSDLPMEDIHNMTKNVPRVPLNSRQALGMLMTSNDEQVETSSVRKPAEPVKEMREDHK